MSSLRRQQIKKRVEAYTQMDEIPKEVAEKIPAHYMEDVPALLLQITDGYKSRFFNGFYTVL